MKKVCTTYVLPILFFLISLQASAALYTFSGNATLNGISGPINKCDAKWSAQAMIYPSSGFNGGAGFGSVTTVGFRCVGSGTNSAIPFKIWLKTTASTTFAGTPTLATALTGATLVYQGTMTSSIAQGWYDFTLSTPYTWSADNLEIIVESDWAQVAGCGTAPVWAYNNATATDQQWLSNTSAANLQSVTPSSPDQFRPDTRINVSAPPPAPTVTGFNPTSACANSGASVVITGTDFTGATGVSFNGTAATNFTVNSATQITATLPNGATTGTISVTTAGGTGTSASSFTVNPLPATPGNPTSNSPQCNPPGVTVTPNGSIPGAETWYWQTSASGTSTANSSGTYTVTAAGNTTVYIRSQNNTTLCWSATSGSVAVTVNSAPAQPGTISGNATPCPGIATTYSVTAVNGATGYTWTLPNGWTGTSTTNSISATPGVTGGTISVTADNTCGSSTAQTLAVTIGTAPSTPGTITGLDTVCSAGSYTYSVASVNGATSYNWTLPNGWTGTSTTNSINATSGTTGGDINVTASNACGSSLPQIKSVYVIPAVSTPGTITGPDSLCSGSNGTFSIAPVSGATSYTWTMPSGWSGGSSTETLNATAGATGGSVTVMANNGCGSSSASSHTVIISAAAPVLGSITGLPNVCEGTAYTYSVSASGSVSSYTWTLPNGWTGTSTTSSISATPNATGGTIEVTGNSTCGSSSPQTLSVNVLAVPATPGTITGNSSVCSGSSNTYSIATVNGASDYTWTLPNGWSGSSATESINTTAGVAGGDVLVTANNTCGSSATPASLSVTIASAPATPGTITGPGTFCNGDQLTYSISSVNGATGYTWTLPNGWTGTSTTETINATAGASAGSITVTADNACGSSQAQTLSVTVGATPATPGTITGPTTFCNGDQLSYSIATVNGATGYTWTMPNGWTGTSVSESINAVASSNGGDVMVTANNACGSSAAQTLTVTAGAAPTISGNISGPTAVCDGSSNSYSISTVNGATGYTWTLPNGWTGTSVSENISATAATAGGAITVTANNGCGSSSPQTINVTISSAPATPGTITGNDPVCEGATGTYTIASVNGATGYTWSLPNGWTGTSVSETITVTVQGAGTVSVTAGNNCGTSQPQTLTVTVNALPTVTFTLSQQTICSNASPLTLSTGTPGGGTYSGQGVTGASFNPSGLAAGNYTITYAYTDGNGCSASDGADIAVTTCSGINEAAESNFAVYPNPFNNQLNISATAEFENAIGVLRDVTGKEIKRFELNFSNGNAVVNTTGLPAGVYALELNTGAHITTVKKMIRMD